jgi:IS1 family transposase
MNQLPIAKRAQIVCLLVEGMSMRAVSRVADVSINTVTKLLADLGLACGEFQDKTMRKLNCRLVQCDEIWSFVGMKQKNVPDDLRGVFGYGDVYTWTAIDPETKLVPCWHVGTRDGHSAMHFISDLADRLAHRVQLTTDGHGAYLQAVADSFNGHIDYAMLVKKYGAEPVGRDAARRYSPAECIGAEKHTIAGYPDPEHVSTSHVARRAPEPDDAHGHAPLHATDQWLLEEGRESHARGQPALHALQLRAHPQDAAGDARHAGRHQRSRLVD